MDLYFNPCLPKIEISISKRMSDMESVDLRQLLMKINEQKQINANLALEFDCIIDTEDLKPLIKVINYCINYISQLTDQQQQISLNASMSGITIGFTAFTESTNLPELSPQVNEALAPYGAKLEQKSEPGKYIQLLITFAQ